MKIMVLLYTACALFKRLFKISRNYTLVGHFDYGSRQCNIIDVKKKCNN